MVSIIIVTKNEEKNISKCLESIKQQDYSDLEVIVVDHPGTTDRTREAVKSFGYPVFEAGPERSEQRNFGIEKAIGEFLFFVDADMRLSLGLVSVCVRKARDSSDAVVVPEISVGEGFWAQCRALEKRLYFGDSQIEAPRFFIRSIFEKVGGYSLGLVSGEDWDLRNKIIKRGGRIGRVNELIYHDEGRLTLVEALKKKFYYGSRARPYLSRNPQSAVSLLKFFIRPAFWRNINYLFLDPVHFVGIIFLKTLEFAAGLSGLILAVVSERIRPSARV